MCHCRGWNQTNLKPPQISSRPLTLCPSTAPPIQILHLFSLCHRITGSQRKCLALAIHLVCGCAMVVAQAAAVVTPVVAAAAPSVSPRPSSRGPTGTGGGLGWRRRRRGSASRGLVIADAFGGTYEDGFGDVELVRTVRSNGHST
jgi:hypothetical protein